MAKRRPAGDGMVRKREDGRWEGRIVIGHKENGEPLFRHVYAKTQKALLDKLHQNIECYRDVELTEDSRMTLGEWLDRWITEYKEGTIRPGTLANYRRYIELYIKPQLGDKQISLITQQDVQRMYRRLKKNGRVREHPELDYQLSDATVCHIHLVMHGAMKDAVQAHVIPRNPTEGTTAPKPNYKPKRILTRPELDAFLEVVEQDDVWRDFFQVELMTGLRRGEICGLQWSDFDEDAGTLKVCRTLHGQRKGAYTIGETKTNQGMRTIILPHSVVDILQRRKVDAIGPWIFPDPVKPEDPVNPGSAYTHMKTLLQHAGLPSIRFHDLRHPYVKHTTKIFSLRLMDFQAQAYNGYPKTKNVLAKTKKECVEKLQKLKEECGGLKPEKVRPEMPFGDWLTYWYENHSKPKIRPTTQETYESRIRLHIIPEIGSIPLNKLTQNDLQQFYGRIKNSGRKRFTDKYGEGLSDRMVRMCHATCRSALEKAVQDGLIRVNPAIGCKLPPKKAREMQVLTREELQRFLIQAKFEGYYEVFLLDLATGLRRGELMALQWDDLNFKTGVLNVNKQVYDVCGQLQISTPKTKSSIRKIVLPPAMVAVLREYKETI